MVNCETHKESESTFVCCSANSSQTYLCGKCFEENTLLCELYKEDIHERSEIAKMEQDWAMKTSELALSAKKAEKYKEEMVKKQKEIEKSFEATFERFFKKLEMLKEKLGRLHDEIKGELAKKFEKNKEFFDRSLLRIKELSDLPETVVLKEFSPNELIENKKGSREDVKGKLAKWIKSYKAVSLMEKPHENLFKFLRLSLNLTIDRKLIESYGVNGTNQNGIHLFPF